MSFHVVSSKVSSKFSTCDCSSVQAGVHGGGGISCSGCVGSDGVEGTDGSGPLGSGASGSREVLPVGVQEPSRHTTTTVHGMTRMELPPLCPRGNSRRVPGP